MNTQLYCLPCMVRQALEATDFVAENEQQQERILRKVLAALSEADLKAPPPAIAQVVHRIIRDETGNTDPYRNVKSNFNKLALAMINKPECNINSADDPFSAAVRLAIAGNVIDCGAKTGLTENGVEKDMKTALSQGIIGDIDKLRNALESAKSVLYITDNAGEIVFDRPLIDYIGRDRVTVAVRGIPVLNDATMEDAEEAGLTEMVNVIDNGSDAPGTILSDCSQIFLQHFNNADLIIAKGQGNFESLNAVKAPLFFLF
jgi:uncharacterized protein with ATP-grasp and redox domains